MLVDPDGAFLSQREVPALATVVPAVERDVLTAAAPGLPLLTHRLIEDGPLVAVSVWGKHGLAAIDQGDLVAEWFTTAIAQRCRLVRFGPMTRNAIDPAWSPREGAETAFTDGFPLLAVVEASLADLNRRLPAPVPMSRFRPNAVVGGAPAWSEDDWRVLTIGSVAWDAAKPCARCVVTTTDQESGQRDPGREPLRTLASFRTTPGLGAIFGQNLVPRGTGLLRVGDAVTVA